MTLGLRLVFSALALSGLLLPAAAQPSGCGGEIAAFRRVMDGDAATGNMNRSVYARMKPEVDRAEVACSAGRGAEAVRMLAGTKRRYGYP